MKYETSISFETKYYLKPFGEDGRSYTGTVGIAHTDSSTYLIDPEEIIITDTEIKIRFDYPFASKRLVITDTENENGFTREELFVNISREFKNIWEDETIDEDINMYFLSILQSQMRVVLPF